MSRLRRGSGRQAGSRNRRDLIEGETGYKRGRDNYNVERVTTELRSQYGAKLPQVV